MLRSSIHPSFRSSSRNAAKNAGPSKSFSGVHQHANPPHALGLLRASGERPCNGRTSYDFDEIAASHYSPKTQEHADTGSLQQEFATSEMGFRSQVAEQQF
jgi:hypothetical protein